MASETPLEHEQRFSRSLLWRMQRRFFAERGLDAWSRNTVPHYITNNPALADAYVHLVLAQLRDRVRSGRAGDRTYIVELGAGSGRFAHHFLSQFLPRLEASGVSLPVTYVLTDTVPSLIDHWRAHPRLRPHVARGVLDFAVFDATAPAPLVLAESGTRLEPRSASAPLIVLANYVFDSIPCDCFSMKAGMLCEGLTTLRSSVEAPDPTAPALLPTLQIDMSECPIEGPYYGEPIRDAILAHYQERLGDTRFLFPTAALDCLDHLSEIGGGVFALIADRGLAHELDLQRRNEPELALHGSFSLLVNFHAIAEYARRRDGEVLQTSYRTPRLEIMALAMGDAACPDARETRATFRDVVEHGCPADRYTLKKAIERHYDSFDLPQLLAYLRLTRWDTNVFWGMYPVLLREAETASARLKLEVRAAAAHVWESYFSIGEPDDLALLLSSLCYAIGDYHEARRYLQHSFDRFGRQPTSLFNLALCHFKLGEHTAALRELDGVFALSPGFAPARELRSRIESESAATIAQLL